MTKDTNELFQSFFAICLLLVPVYGGLERRCTPDTPIRGIYCGETLNSVLEMTCRFYGGFYGGSKKRSAPSNNAFGSVKRTQAKTTILEKLPDLLTTLRDSGVDSKNILSKQVAHNFLKKRTSHGQGSSCECCYHRCTMSELREYCSFGSSDSDSLFDDL